MDEFLGRIQEAFRPSSDKQLKTQQLLDFFESNKNSTISNFVQILTNPEIRSHINEILFQFILTLSTKLFPRNITQRTQNPFDEIDPDNIRALFNALVHICIEFPRTSGSIAALSLQPLIQCDIAFGSAFGFESDVVQLFFDPQVPEAQANFICLLNLVIKLTEIDEESAHNILLRANELIDSNPDDYLSNQILQLVDKIIQTTNIMENGPESVSIIFTVLMKLIQIQYTKSAAYEVFREIFELYYPLTKEVGQPLLEQSFNDIKAESQEKAVIVNILDLWKQICINERKAIEQFSFIQNNFENMFPILMEISSNIPSEDVSPLEENDPHVIASQVISKIIKMKVGHQAFTESLPTLMGSSNPGEQELSLTIIANLIYFGDITPFINEFYSFISEKLSSPIQRIREDAIIIVKELIDVIVNKKQPNIVPFIEQINGFLLSLLETIANLMKTDTITSSSAAKTLIDYLTLPDFSEAETILTHIFEASESDNEAIAHECISSLNMLCKIQNDDVVLAVLPVILSLLEEKCTQDDPSLPQNILILELLDNLTIFYDKLHGKLTQEIVEKSWELFTSIHEEKHDYNENILRPIAALAVNAGEELFGSKLEDSIEILISSLQQSQYPNTIQNACIGITIIGEYYDLESCADHLLQITSELLKQPNVLETKSYIADALNTAICASPTTFIGSAESILIPFFEASTEFESVRMKQEKQILMAQEIEETQSQAMRFLKVANTSIKAFIEGGIDIGEILGHYVEFYMIFAGLPCISYPDFVKELIEFAYSLLSNFDDIKEQLMQCDGLLQAIRVASQYHILDEQCQEISTFFAS